LSQKNSSSTGNSKLDLKLDSTKFETHFETILQPITMSLITTRSSLFHSGSPAVHHGHVNGVNFNPSASGPWRQTDRQTDRRRRRRNAPSNCVSESDSTIPRLTDQSSTNTRVLRRRWRETASNRNPSARSRVRTTLIRRLNAEISLDVDGD